MKNKNHNHFIAKVYDKLNPIAGEAMREIQAPYFDGTQAQAIAYFRTLLLLKPYRGKERYRILISANSLELDFNC